MGFTFNNIVPKNITFNNSNVKTLIYNNVVVWSQTLPAGYTQLDYIASTGIQYIDTGIIPNQNTGFEIEFLSNNEISSTAGEFGAILGAREKSSVNELQLTSYTTKDSGHNGTLRFGSTTHNANITVGEKNKVTLKNKKYTSNGTEQRLEGEFLSPSTLALFALNQNGTATQYGNVRIYSCKIYDGNKLVRNFIPCDYNGEAGLYDLVYGQFYINQGEGQFVKGYKLPSEYQLVEYIKTTGTQHIDSGVPLRNGLKIVVDWVYADADSGNSYTGGHIGSPGNRWLIGSQRSNTYFFAVGTGNVPTEFTFGDRDVVEAYWKDKNSHFICNGVKSTKYNYQIYTLAEEPTYTYYMGAVNRTGSATLKPKLTIYNWKFYQDDNLVRDYVPCYRKSDNVIGMYDLVNGKFYTNKGTGTFLKGNDI
jgi:hypothetical protein